MKQVFAYTAIIFNIGFLTAQNFTTLERYNYDKFVYFLSAIGSESKEYATDIAQLSDKNLLVTATDRIILKTDKHALAKWAKKYSSPTDSFQFRKILPDYQNAAYLLGTNFLCKADSSGKIVWAKKYYVSASTQLCSIIKCYDKNLLISASDSNHVIIIKADTVGNVLWSKHYYNDVAFHTGNVDIAEMPDHSIAIVSTVCNYDYNFINFSGNYIPSANILLLKTDKNGNLLWSKKTGNVYKKYSYIMLNGNYDSFGTYGGHLIGASDNSIVVTFSNSGNSGGGIPIDGGGRYYLSCSVAKYDSLGNPLFIAESGSISGNVAPPVSEGPKGTLNILGAFYLLKTDLNFQSSSAISYAPRGSYPPASYRPCISGGYDYFKFTNMSKFSNNQVAIVGGAIQRSSGINILLTDTDGFESCTSAKISYYLNSDTLLKTDTVNLKTSIGIFSMPISIKDSTISISRCNCDSVPNINFSFKVNGDTVKTVNSTTNANAFRWKLDGFDMANNTLRDIVFNLKDTFDHCLILTAYNRCAVNTSTSLSISVKDTSGFVNYIFHQISTGYVISVYPNPAISTITIESSIVKPYTIQLLNMLGETVYSIKEMITGKTTIDLGILPKGIYIVQLLDKEGNTINRQRLVRE